MTVDIVLCADRGAVLGLAATVRSALEASTDTIDVHVLVTGVGPDEQEKLLRSWNHKDVVAFASTK